MVCMEEVFLWFKELKETPRIDFICELLNFCTPLELRFFGTILEDLGKKDFSCLWEDEQKLNSGENEVPRNIINDPVVRSQLIVTLVLLHSNNRLSAAKIFDVLLEELQFEKLSLVHNREEKCLNETMLLLTLAARHPAFTFEQKSILSDHRLQLEKISQPSRSAFSPQDIAIYANSNTFGSTFATVPPDNLQEPADMGMVLSMYPPLSTAVTPVTTTYLTTCPQPISRTSALNVMDSTLAQISSLEFSGIEKNRNYRIRVFLSNGKQIELVKSAQDISTFHQKLLPSLSQGAQIGNSETIIPPFPPNYTSHNNNFSHVSFEDVPENKVQLVEYFRKLSGILHLLDHEVLLEFIHSPKQSPVSSLYIDESVVLQSPGAPNLYQPTQYQPTNDGLIMVQSLSNLPNTSLTETRISSSRPCVPLSSPTASPLSSPISSPLVSPPASETSSRSASPLQQMSHNSSNQSRALRSKTSRLAQDVSTVNPKLQNTSFEDLDSVDVSRGHVGKPKKFDPSGMQPPNGISFKQYQKHCPIASKSSQHHQPTTPVMNSYSHQMSRSRSESSHSFSDCSGSSSPLSDGSNGQGSQQIRNRVSSSSEENLEEHHGHRGKSDQGSIRSSLATSIVTYSNSSICHSSIGLITPVTAAAGLSKYTLEGHVINANPMINHPFKNNQLLRTSPGSQHFSGQMPVDNRLLQMNPTMHVIASNSIPPPGLPHPNHLSPGNLPPPNDRCCPLSIPGMLPYNPGLAGCAMTTALAYTAGTCSRSHAVLKNNCASVTTTSSQSGTNNVCSNSHRYSPPKVHNPIDKGSVVLQTATTHQLPDFMPMILTQPPPPVQSNTPVPISGCLSHHCNCSTSVTSSLGPMSAIPQGPPPTNSGAAPATMPYTVGFLPPVFPHHAFQFVTSHSGGATPNGYIMQPFNSYPIHNGVSGPGHELIHYGLPIPVSVSVPVTSVPGSGSTVSTPTVQQGVPGAPMATITGPNGPLLGFSGNTPFPQMGGIHSQPKIISCHNCGAQGHKGQDCKEATSDDIQKMNQFRINYNSTSKQPVDSHD